MMKAFQVRSPQGNLRQEYYPNVNEEMIVTMLESFVTNEEWYEISKHDCYNDEGKPCEPWEVVKEKGEIPEAIH